MAISWEGRKGPEMLSIRRCEMLGESRCSADVHTAGCCCPLGLRAAPPTSAYSVMSAGITLHHFCVLRVAAASRLLLLVFQCRDCS